MFDKMQQATTSIIEAIKQLPFIIELIQGNLANDTFNFYLQQDVFYLSDYARALALIGARVENRHHCHQFLQFALEGIAAENNLHANYIARIQPKINVIPYKISPTCFTYSHYLVRLAALSPVEEAIAALLPCFTIYYEIGCFIAKNSKNKNNFYQEWIDMYTSKDFAESTQRMINIINQITATTSTLLQEKMLTAFVTASKLEWQFWHSAYHKEKWPI